MSKVITHDEFVQMVQDNNKYVNVIGKYNGMRNKILCQCKICGEQYEAIAQDVKIGKIHSICAAKISGQKRLKSNEQFVNELKSVLPHVSPLEPYSGSHNKILCSCNIHNEFFVDSPTKLLLGQCGCKKCKSELISMKLRNTHIDFETKLHSINNEIELLGKYITSKDRIKVKCKKCNFIWEPIAGSLLAGNGCPHCVGRHKTTEEFINEIKQINDSINIIGEYVDSKTKVRCRCNICGHEWLAMPGNLRYSGCPECNISHGERAIKDCLISHNIDFVTHKIFPGLVGVGGGNLSYDFWLEKSHILIEFQGEFHDGTAYQQTDEQYEVQKEHDNRKRLYAQNHGYKLIEIWYWEYDDINKILERELC